jgi:aldose 1-epimerase
MHGGVSVPGFALRNRHGVMMKVVAYGARLTELHVPDANGNIADIVLGFDTLGEYVASDAYMGATCGRYGSRIRDAAFVLGGRKVQLSRNEGAHHAHGGSEGFDRKVWHAHADAQANAVLFTHHSPDGDEGYPGALTATTSYRLTDANVLEIVMRAQSDRATVISLVHHSYWNLAGHGGGDVLAQQLQVPADFYLPIDADLVPTGEVHSLTGTPFDFRETKAIGRDLPAVATPSGGYDHHWCVRGTEGELRLCAALQDPMSGRAIELHATAPGVQCYTAGHLRNVVSGKGGARYGRYAAVALETQRFPDAPNLGHFPRADLVPGQIYEHRVEVRLTSRA